MTFTDIVNEVADRLNLTSSQAITRIGRSVNERYKWISSSISLPTIARSTASASTVIGSRSVVFGPNPVGVEKIYTVYNTVVSPARVLQEVTFDELRARSSGTGSSPHSFAIQLTGSSTVTIFLDITPTTIFTLTADVSTNLSTLSGVQVPAFSEDFHDILIYGAMATEYDKMEKQALSDKYEKRYLDRLSDLRMFVIKSPTLDLYQGKTRHTSASGGTGGGGGTNPTNSTATFAQDGTGAITRSIRSRLIETVSLYDFGAVGDGIVDDTAAINNAYAAAAGNSRPLTIPPGVFRFTSKLTWDKAVTILGSGRSNNPNKRAVLKKDGNFVGIEFAGNGDNIEISGFVLDSFKTGGDTSDGMTFNDGGAAGVSMRNVTIQNHGGVGLHIVFAALCRFDNISCLTNLGGGIYLQPTGSQFVTACVFTMLDIRQSGYTNSSTPSGNGAVGMRFVNGGLGVFGNFAYGIVAQNNDGYGVRVDTGTNELSCYVESNGGDIFLDTTSTRNFVKVFNSSVSNPAVVDNGTANTVFDFSLDRWNLGDSLAPSIPGTNIAGRPYGIEGGHAGAGAVGHAGGRLQVSGGNAVGAAGGAPGGIMAINGGSGVNGGLDGQIEVDGPGTAGVVIGGNGTIGVSVSMDFQSTTRVPRLPRLTTTQRDALTPLDGMILYNTSTSKVNIRDGGAWVAL